MTSHLDQQAPPLDCQYIERQVHVQCSTVILEGGNIIMADSMLCTLNLEGLGHTRKFLRNSYPEVDSSISPILGGRDLGGGNPGPSVVIKLHIVSRTHWEDMNQWN